MGADFTTDACIILPDNMRENDLEGAFSCDIKTPGSFPAIGAIFSVGSTASVAPAFVLRLDAGVIRYIFRNDLSGDLTLLDGSTLAPNTWYKLVMTSDGLTIRIYIDGVLEVLNPVVGTNTGDWIGDLGSTFTHAYQIGCQVSTGGPVNHFEGIITNFVLYDFNLVQDDADKLAGNDIISVEIQNELVGKPVMGHLLEGPDGVSATDDQFRDTTGNDNNGTGIGTVTYKSEEVLNSPPDEFPVFFVEGVPIVNPLFVKDPDLIYIGGETELQDIGGITELQALVGETELQLVN